VLGILNEYWNAGEFPKNTYVKGYRRPVFIDASGVHCAVGYLMQKTGHGELAQEIDSNNKFVLVEKLVNKRAAAWMNEYGLSKEEAAVIQPGYRWEEYSMILERSSYGILDYVWFLLMILASVALIFFVKTYIKLDRNKLLSNEIKKKSKLKLAGGFVLVVVLSFLIFPNPVVYTIDKSNETIYCPSSGNFNSAEYAEEVICSEAELNKIIPGWRRAK